MKKLFLLTTALCLFVSSSFATPVSLELLLSIDVSGSISTSEYNLMMDGYADAFRDADVVDKITSSSDGIAVGVMQWALNQEERGWYHLTDATSVENFAVTLETMSRSSVGNTTDLSKAIAAGGDYFTNGFEGDRLVMDISGDGEDNVYPYDVASARDAELADGIVINGITVGDASLQTYYANNVIGGTNSFGVHADNFDDFAVAINNKIEKEIVNTPEPASASLFILGLGSLLGLCFRRRK